MDKVTVEQFNNALEIIRLYQKQIRDEYELIKSIEFRKVKTETEIRDLDLSVRLLNGLSAANIKTVEQLLRTDLKILYKQNRIGKKSINELQEFINTLIIIE